MLGLGKKDEGEPSDNLRIILELEYFHALFPTYRKDSNISNIQPFDYTTLDKITDKIGTKLNHPFRPTGDAVAVRCHQGDGRVRARVVKLAETGIVAGVSEILLTF